MRQIEKIRNGIDRLCIIPADMGSCKLGQRSDPQLFRLCLRIMESVQHLVLKRKDGDPKIAVKHT